jgi:hypothetical protein
MDVGSATSASTQLPLASPNPVPAKAAQGDPGTDAGPAPADAPTPLECVTYGVLGIDAPDGQTPSEGTDYHAGQWAGAALKIGGIIALLA